MEIIKQNKVLAAVRILGLDPNEVTEVRIEPFYVEVDYVRTLVTEENHTDILMIVRD